MNSKLLYAAIVAVSVISTIAMADPAPLTRAQVNADVQQARADGMLQRTDCDDAASMARQSLQHRGSVNFAQRFKATFARDAS